MNITVTDFLNFTGRTIGGLSKSIARLDDDLVNVAPDLPGANSPFVIVTHALGAARWWTEHVICGHMIERDRDSEFVATGTVAEAVENCANAQAKIVTLGAELDAATTIQPLPDIGRPRDFEWTVGAALIHTYEELAQHLGHLEITVDLLLAERISSGEGG